MKRIHLLFTILIIVFASLASCEKVVEGDPEPITYQMIVDIEDEGIETGYAPRIVYESNVVEANRPTPSIVYLDFTEFLDKKKGQLPINIVEDNFQVTAELRQDNTYLVKSAFTSFN
jgi:hypothetical protein